MAEVELYPHPPHQNIVNVIVGSNTDSDPEIETEFAYNWDDGDNVTISGVFGFTDINNSGFDPIEVVDTTRFNLLGYGSSTQTYITGGIVRNDNKYFNKNSNASNIRPTFVGTNLYFPVVAVIFNSASPPAGEFMYQMRSTDTGVTWTVLDSANSPSHEGNWSWNVLQTDTKFWYTLQTSGTTIAGRSWQRFRMTDFDITAGTWGALDTSTNIPLGDPPDTQFTEMYPLSSDRILWYHVNASLRANSTTVDFERPSISIFDITDGTWASVNNIVTRDVAALSTATAGTPGTFTSSAPHLMETGDFATVAITGMTGTNTQTVRVTVTGASTFILDGSDVSGTFTTGSFSHDYNVFPCWAIPSAIGDGIHLFYGKDQTGTGSANFSTLYHKHVTVDSGNSLTYGDEQTVNAKTTLRTLPLGVGCSYTSGTNTKIEFPLAVSTSTATTGSIDIDDQILGISFTSEEEPTYTTETIISVQSEVPSVDSEGPWGQFAHNPTNNKIYLVYQLDDKDHPNSKTDLWIRSKTVGGAWGTATLWKTDSEYFYGHPSVHASDTRVHVIYSKLHPNDLSFGEGGFTDLHDFPHYDAFEVCPVAGSSGNYAYLS